MENYFTIKQVAFILKVHPLSVRRYIREKKLLAVKFGGAVRIKEEDLHNFQKGYTTNNASKGSIIKEAPKVFSFDDPLWQLNGKGGSLTMPQDEGR